jgi:F0F1-type ATP synthase epsilon subunit
MALTFDIVSPSGTRLHGTSVDCVVFRRREAEHDPGSEVAILPRHGPLLMQTQSCAVRVTREGLTQEFEVGAGVLEVFRDHVTLVET